MAPPAKFTTYTTISAVDLYGPVFAYFFALDENSFKFRMSTPFKKILKRCCFFCSDISCKNFILASVADIAHLGQIILAYVCHCQFRIRMPMSVPHTYAKTIWPKCTILAYYATLNLYRKPRKWTGPSRKG